MVTYNSILAATNAISSELLSIGSSGLIGLATQDDSLIVKQVPPTTGNNPDGAPIASNIFGIGQPSGPLSHFIGLSFERPGSSTIPSLLAIGTHPSEVVPDPSKINYNDLASGSRFWELPATGLTVFLNDSKPSSIPLGGSVVDKSSIYPIAILDSGTPAIFTRRDIANAFYGAWGIGPASDQNCTSAILHFFCSYVYVTSSRLCGLYTSNERNDYPWRNRLSHSSTGSLLPHTRRFKLAILYGSCSSRRRVKSRRPVRTPFELVWFTESNVPIAPAS
jgi:hypothetical protein